MDFHGAFFAKTLDDDVGRSLWINSLPPETRQFWANSVAPSTQILHGWWQQVTMHSHATCDNDTMICEMVHQSQAAELDTLGLAIGELPFVQMNG